MHRRSLLVHILIIGIIVCVVSCSEKGLYQTPRFSKTDNQSFELIAEDLALGNTKALFVYKDALIVCSYVPNGRWLHAYDANNGTLLATAIPQGRGPGEGLSLHAPYLNADKGLLSFYDFYLHKLLTIDLDVFLANGESTPVELTPYIPMSRANSVIPSGNGYLLSNYFTSFDREMEEGLNRFMFFDKDENLVSEYSIWPEIEEVALMSLYSMPPMGVASDAAHWVVGTKEGAILESFSLNGKKIQRDWIRYFYPTDMQDHLNDGANSESVLGFDRICFANDLIYTAIDFHHTLKQVVSKEFKNHPEPLNSEIAVFNLEGKPVRLIKTGVRINEITTNGETLYAVIENAEGSDCLARMKLVE